MHWASIRSLPRLLILLVSCDLVEYAHNLQNFKQATDGPSQVEEMFSEDPYLAGEMGYHYTKGLQSTNVSATVKHFIGFGEPEQGINTAPVQGGERYLRSTYVVYPCYEDLD